MVMLTLMILFAISRMFIGGHLLPGLNLEGDQEHVEIHEWRLCASIFLLVILSTLVLIKILFYLQVFERYAILVDLV